MGRIDKAMEAVAAATRDDLADITPRPVVITRPERVAQTASRGVVVLIDPPRFTGDKTMAGVMEADWTFHVAVQTSAGSAAATAALSETVCRLVDLYGVPAEPGALHTAGQSIPCYSLTTTAYNI